MKIGDVMPEGHQLQKHTRIKNDHIDKFFTFVNIKKTLEWRLNQETLAEALRYYALNYADCPEHIRSHPGKSEVVLHFGSFQVSVESQPSERLSEYEEYIDKDGTSQPGTLKADWVKRNGQWMLKEYYGAQR